MLSNKSSLSKAYIALSWVSIFWGTTWLASRIGVTYMPALQMIGIRQFLGGLVFILYFLFKKHPLPKGKEWKSIFILSVLNFVFSNGFVIWGVHFIPSGLGAIIGAIFPLWVVVISVCKGKKLSAATITGMVLGFGGICVIFYNHLLDFLNAGFRFGIFISLIASVTWAFGSMYTQKKSQSFNPYFSLGFQMVISSLVFFSAAKISGDVIAIKDIPATCWWCILYLVVVGSGFTFVAYIYALRHLPISLASVYAYINPIVAVILGALVLHETITTLMIIGGLITLSGVLIVNNSFRNKLN